MAEDTQQAPVGPMPSLEEVIKDPVKIGDVIERYQKAESDNKAAAAKAHQEVADLQRLAKELDEREKSLEDSQKKQTHEIELHNEDLRKAETSLKRSQSRLKFEFDKLHGERLESRKTRDAGIAHLEALRTELNDRQNELNAQATKLKAREGNIKVAESQAADLKAKYDGKVMKLRQAIED